MRIHIDHYFHFEEGTEDGNRKLDKILSILERIKEKENKIMAGINEAVNEVIAAANENMDRDDSIMQVLLSFIEQVEANKDNAAKLTELTTAIKAKSVAIVDAINNVNPVEPPIE